VRRATRRRVADAMIRVIEGDCIATLRTLPAGIAQTCVTSPPYYGLRDYGVDGQIGLEDTPDAYVARLVEVFREVRRVLRDDGTLWLNLGDSYKNFRIGQCGQSVHAHQTHDQPTQRRRGWAGAKEKDLLMIPAQVALALRADGWYLRKDIIWHKPNPMPESVTDRPTSAHEHVFLLAKSPRYFYDAEAIAEDATFERNAERPFGCVDKAQNADRNDGGRKFGYPATRNARDVWTIATQPYSGAHFATMPPDLAERCIKAGSSERGQCPHCGSPWQRVVERTAMVLNRSERTHSMGRIRTSGTMVEPPRSETIGWAPSCCCPEHQPVPQVVLDPFGGAGTTGLVADRLGRSAILCELNPEYARLARERLTADAPLLAVVA
jgi:DNA modification methylase